jgi:hypothetical protein
MTWLELAREILDLPAGVLSEPVNVVPPKACPATEAVPVTGIVTEGLRVPVLSTGKKPEGVGSAGDKK